MLFKELVELTKSDPMIEVVLPIEGIGSAKVQKYKEGWLRAFADGEGDAPLFCAAIVENIYPVDDILQVRLSICSLNPE